MMLPVDAASCKIVEVPHLLQHSRQRSIQRFVRNSDTIDEQIEDGTSKTEGTCVINYATLQDFFMFVE